MPEAQDPAAEVRALIDRTPRHAEHGPYLEAFHELANKALAVIHLRLAQGDIEGATDLTSRLRNKLDDMWEARKAQAARGGRT